MIRTRILSATDHKPTRIVAECDGRNAPHGAPRRVAHSFASLDPHGGGFSVAEHRAAALWCAEHAPGFEPIREGTFGEATYFSLRLSADAPEGS